MFQYDFNYTFIRKKYLEVHNYHPVFGDSWRPIVMDEYTFDDYCKKYNYHWWNWEIWNEHLPPVEDMIDDLEFTYGSYQNILAQKIEPIRLVFPLYRVSKYKTKTGKQSLVSVYYLPPGKLYDANIAKQKALLAYNDIIGGRWNVVESISRNKSTYDAIMKHTNYIPQRNVIIQEKVKKVTDLILTEKMKEFKALEEVGLTKQTFIKRTGGKFKLLYDYKKVQNFNS